MSGWDESESPGSLEKEKGRDEDWRGGEVERWSGADHTGPGILS